MRFMFIVKSAHSGPPTPELLEAMNKLADREIKAGRMLDNAGLTPLGTGAQVRVKDRLLEASSTARFCGGERGHRRLRCPRAAGQRRGLGVLRRRFMQLHKDVFAGWEGTCEISEVAGP